MSEAFTLTLSASLAEAIAQRAAEIVLVRLRDECLAPSSPYLNVAEAADHLRCSPQRIYDLLSSGRIRRQKDGRRVLVSRAELDAYVAPEGSSPVAPALPHADHERFPRGVAE